MTHEGNNSAIELVSRALEIDPDYAVAAGLGAGPIPYGLPRAGALTLPRKGGAAFNSGRRAVTKGEDDADALAMGGYAVAFLGEELHEGLSAIERAIRLNPNGALAFANAGWVRSYLGQADASVQDFEQSISI